jgi:hypothetical protein
LQVYLRADEVGEQGYALLDLVDLGDFVGVAGTVMRTRKGELSVQARELVLLSKALLPPPEKWHGLADVEVRYRQRYLDLVANPEVRQAFLRRSAMVSAIRRFQLLERAAPVLGHDRAQAVAALEAGRVAGDSPGGERPRLLQPLGRLRRPAGDRGLAAFRPAVLVLAHRTLMPAGAPAA